MKITFTFGSEEVDCGELINEMGLDVGLDEQEKSQLLTNLMSKK